MEREKYDILISELIYKSLTDNLKGNEADILEAWLQNPDNRKFYMDLKNSDRLLPLATMSVGGSPSSDRIIHNSSSSSSPGHSGLPISNSIITRAVLHTSMGGPYVIPIITSGAR